MLSPLWKTQEQRPGKGRRNVILKLAPPKDHTSTWELNYFLAGEQRRAECALHLSVEQMAPHDSHGPWPGGMGVVSSRASSRPWLHQVEFGVSVPLEMLPCFGWCLVFCFGFGFFVCVVC